MRCGLLLLALAGLAVGCGGNSTPAPQLMRVPVLDSPQKGPSDAWVTVVEFADFQCPYCGAAEPTVEQVLADYPTDVRLVFKHFPLSQHANARAAANAAECARAQATPLGDHAAPNGYFWDMHDLLFAHQSALDPASLALYAGQIADLDAAAWQTCFDARQYDARVSADEDLGASVGVAGTPTFVINGAPLEGAWPLATFEAKVDAARQQAIASGIPRADYYRVAVLGQ